MSVLRILFRWVDCATLYSNYMAIVSIVLMSLLILIEVICRRFLGFSTLISEEWTSYLQVYLIFFGLAHTFKLNAFIQVELMITRLSKNVQEGLKFICIILAFIFIIIFDYELIIFVLSSYQKNLRSISFSETPLIIPQIAMPIGVSLLGLQLVKEGINSLLTSKGLKP